MNLRAIAVLRLLRAGVWARAQAAHLNGRTEASAALLSVHDDLSGLLILLERDRRPEAAPVDMTAADQEAREDNQP